MSDIFVWNETLGEQVRSQTERAINGQSSDMRSTAESFRSEADRHEAQADQLESRLPIMKTITETREDHQGGTYTVSRSVENVLATQQARAQIREMRAQAQEVRRAADELERAADELDREAEALNKLFREYFELTQSIDGACAARMEAIRAEIEAHIRNIEAIRDSFGADFTSMLGDGPQTISTLAVAALVAVNPQLAGKMAGVQSVCASGLDPINLATGNFYYTKEDIRIPRRYPLAFTRFYNAIGGFDSVLGPNWTHNYNIRLYNEDNEIRIVFDDGRTETYNQIADNRYVSPIEGKNTLAVPEDDEGGFVLILQTMVQYRFDDTGALRQIIDINGNTTYLEYNAEALLSKVHNASGSLIFSYNEEGRLTQVADYTGREVIFDYATEGHLQKVIHPTGATYQYEYGNHGLISKIINPMGIVTVHNDYDKDGRTIRQLMADGGIAHIKYNDANKSNTVIEQNGNKIEYYRDEKYRTTRIAYEHFDERFVFNDNNNCTQYTDRNKNSWQYEHDLFGNITMSIDPMGKVTEMEYGDLNKPTKITNPNGGIISLSYDDYGNMISTTTPLGHQTNCVYDETGNLVKLTMADASESHLKYDQRGNIASVTDSQGVTTRYEYDILNQVSKTINGEGAATTFEYDTKGNITKVTNAQGHTRHYEYNLSSKVTRITDFDGGIVEYKYNPVGKVEEITDQQGGTTKITYDLMQNITGVTDPMGSTISYEYDQYNRVISTIDPEGYATTYKHDPNGNVISAISPLGAQVKITYDALNRQKSIIEPGGATTRLKYDPLGNVTEVTDAQGNITKREYDLASQLAKLTDPLGNETTMTYTPLGQIQTVTNPKGETQTYNYYPGGRLKSVILPCGETETYEYNKIGQVSKVTDALGNATTLTYDSLDRVIKSTNPLGHSKHFTYDATGNITHIKDENGNTTQYRYSPLGDIIEVIDATGHSTKYGYDAARRLTELRQYNNPGEPQIITYQRNKKGEVISTTSPLGDIVKYDYDATGNVTHKQDEDGLETLYEYNLAGRLAQITYADGRTVALTYNALKQLTEMRDWLGTTKIEIDALGRTTKTIDYEGNQIGYTYNAASQREKLTYPNGKEVVYEYNASGRLETVKANAETTRYTYDPAGRLSQRILPDNTTTDYQFNPLGVLSSLTHSKANRVLDQFKYSYDPVGNITEIEKYRTGIESDNGVFKYTYDPLNRLVRATSPQSTKIYAYDNLCNRTSSQQNGMETRHTFNARNQLVRTMEGDATTDYTYDKRGNLTQKLQNGQLQASYAFDAANMMVSAHNPNKGTAEYTYDGFRNRVKKLENYQASANIPDPTKEVRYVLDMTRPYDNLLMTQGQNQQTQSFTWGNGLLSASTDISSLHYLQDHIGSPIRMLDADSETPMAYDEFGVPVIDSVPNTNPFGFTGYQIDDISGMYYAQARYYTPDAGRFVAEDPIKDQLNWYGYCNANPINFIDPTGLFNQNMFGDGVYEENGTGGNRTVITPGGNRAPSTPGPSGGNGSHNNDDCPARGRSHADMWYQICIENGLVAIDGITGDTIANLHPPLNHWIIESSISASSIRTFGLSQHGNDTLFINGRATNFTVNDFASGCGANEVRIDGLMIYYLNRFDMSFDGDIIITSGFRTQAHDEAVSSGTGQHRYGRAVDFGIAGVAQQTLLDYALELGFNSQFGFTYRIRRRDGTFATTIHIDTRGR